MDSLVLDAIGFQIDREQLWKTLRIKEGSEHGERLEILVRKAEAVGKPKALSKAAFIESKGDDHVVIDGILFTSRVLRVNLDKVYKVFPYVATCGLELENWSSSIEDLVERYWADAIKQMAVRLAVKTLNQHVMERYRLEAVSRMNPGSLPDWPLPEQRPLFALLGTGPASIGIQLMDSCLMVPIKSVSGIWFPAEGTFESCQLCPREKCPGRRAPYDPNLYDRKYR